MIIKYKYTSNIQKHTHTHAHTYKQTYTYKYTSTYTYIYIPPESQSFFVSWINMATLSLISTRDDDSSSDFKLSNDPASIVMN